MKENLQRMLVKGGVLSPSELKQVIEMAEAHGHTTLHFGSRQDIILPEVTDNKVAGNQLFNISYEYISDRKYQNIVSSYVSANIFPTTRWLSSATYLYILERFHYTPKLQINITEQTKKL